MKINKLTENKIQIIFNTNDLLSKNLDVNTFMKKSVESNGFFLDILDKAEKEVGFDTNGCKLLIEATSSEDAFIFTITKYVESTALSSNQSKPFIPNQSLFTNKNRVVVKRRSFNLDSESMIYKFKDFDTFCEFCNYLKESDISTRAIAKTISLYLYKNTYYLVLDNINSNFKNLKKLLSLTSEFASLVSNSKTVHSKIKEFGETIIKTNALNVGIKYFSNK